MGTKTFTILAQKRPNLVKIMALPAHSVPCWWLWRAGCISQDTYLLYHIWSLQFSINLCDMSQHVLHQLNAAFLLIVKESQSPIYNIKLQILLVICMMLIQYVWVGSVFFGFSLGVAYLRIEKQIHN